MSSSRSDMLNSRFCRRRIPICEQYHSSLPGSRDPPPNTQHLQRRCHIYHLKLSLRYVASIIPGSLLPADLITITLPGTISFKHIKLYHMFSKFLYIYSLKDLLAKIDKAQYKCYLTGSRSDGVLERIWIRFPYSRTWGPACYRNRTKQILEIHLFNYYIWPCVRAVGGVLRNNSYL